MYFLDHLLKSKSLPLGHVGRLEAQDKVDKEYTQCREVEKALWKQYKKLLIPFRGLTESQAREMLIHLSQELGERRIPRLILNSPEVHPCSSAHYSHRGYSIHFPGTYISLTTLLHEYSHFLVHMNSAFRDRTLSGGRGHHGSGFCECLKLSYQAAQALLKCWRQFE